MIRKFLVVALLFILPQVVWTQQKYWIFFSDKGYSDSEIALLKTTEEKRLTERALKRRAKVLPEDQLIESNDLPLFQPYLNELESIGIIPIVKSRWLNAISANITEEQRAVVLSSTFVRRVSPVLKYRIELPVSRDEQRLQKAQIYQLDYGISIDQNELIHVPEVHDLGLDGSGVIIGMLDTGYDYANHEAFEHLKVEGEYDFIHDDSTTQNEEQNNDVSSQINHGTITLSAIGGFKEGELIGPAYGSSYFLAKTEDVRSETEVEEDYWVAGIEWLERQGVDVVNSSLGYNDWYEYSDLNGLTATTTIAADIAVSKGVVVVNSAGNEGNKSWRYMIAPADGFNVISVGAVYSTGELVSFSSRGPTYDGRTKPDVMAMGSDVRSVQPGSLSDYRGASGTSLASPLVAGVAALVLQAHPYLTPTQVRDALRNTATQATSPDNDFGWGIVNAYEAIFYHGLFFSSTPIIYTDESLGHPVKLNVYSKNEVLADSVHLFYSINGNQFVKMTMSEAGDQNSFEAVIPLQTEGTEIQFYFYANDLESAKFHPFYAPESYFTYVAYDSAITPPEAPLPEEFRLYQNYPNPFRKITTISYDIFEPGDAQLVIFNILGQRVRTLKNGFHNRHNYKIIWDGLDERGSKVAAGIYLVQLKTQNFSTVKRMVFLHAK